MATMKDMIGQMLDKIADQAAQIARRETARNRFENQAKDWEERALRAEQKPADSADWQVSSQNNYEAYKAEQCRAEELRVRLEATEAILKKSAEYTDVAVAFELADLSRDYFATWAEPEVTGTLDGSTAQSYVEEVVSNGRGGTSI